MYKTYGVGPRKLNKTSRKYQSIQPEMEQELLNNQTLPAMDHNVQVEPHYLYRY